MYPSLWYYTKYFSLPPKIMATSDPFNVLHTFPFPEYHIVGTLQYAAFLDWFLAHGNMHLTFLHVLSWLDNSFLLAVKSLQLCPTLCDPRDGSPPGSPVPGTLQARTLEQVAISFSNA